MDRIKIANKQALAAGLLVVAMGIAIIVIAFGYPLGTLGRMGPGFFPMILGGLSVCVGLGIIVFEAFGKRGQPVALAVQEDIVAPAGVEQEDTQENAINWRALVLVPLGLLAFAQLLERFGLIWAVCALVMISGFAERKPRPLSLVLIALGTSLGVWLVFIVGLGLPLRVV